MSYLTLQEVRDRLRIDDAYGEDDLLRMVVEAEDIVRDYLDRAVPFTAEDVPARVRTATLLVVQSLYDSDEDPITIAVRSILHRTRKPVLA